MIIFGTRTFGKVDQVPGLFYVVTRFGHFDFLPLIPMESYVLMDDGSQRGVPIGTSGKSVLVAWLRAILLISAVFLVLGGIIGLAQARDEEKLSFVMKIVGGSLLLPFWWASYRWTHAGLDRALELAEYLEIPPRVIHVYFNGGFAEPPYGSEQTNDPTPRDTQ
jgi:hypothetical protein